MPGLKKLIVVSAFKRHPDGTFEEAHPQREMQSEEEAREAAMAMKDDYDGVVAWCREVDAAVGDTGLPVVLFQSGSVPEF